MQSGDSGLLPRAARAGPPVPAAGGGADCLYADLGDLHISNLPDSPKIIGKS